MAGRRGLGHHTDSLRRTGLAASSTPCQDAAASGGEVHRREALHRCVNFISLYLALSPVNHLSSPMGWQDAVTLHRQ